MYLAILTSMGYANKDFELDIIAVTGVTGVARPILFNPSLIHARAINATDVFGLECQARMGNPPVFFFFIGVVHILIAMYQYFGAGGNPQITLATSCYRYCCIIPYN